MAASAFSAICKVTASGHQATGELGVDFEPPTHSSWDLHKTDEKFRGIIPNTLRQQPVLSQNEPKFTGLNDAIFQTLSGAKPPDSIQGASSPEDRSILSCILQKQKRCWRPPQYWGGRIQESSESVP